MYEFLNEKDRREVRAILLVLMRHSVVLPFAMPTGFAILFGIVGVLVGLEPIDFAISFLGEALLDLSGLIANLWIICFLCAAFFFGIGRNLPRLLQHRSLNSDVVARFTQTFALDAPCLEGIATLFWGPFHRLPLLVRPSRVALSTSSALAGAAPKLE